MAPEERCSACGRPRAGGASLGLCDDCQTIRDASDLTLDEADTLAAGVPLDLEEECTLRAGGSGPADDWPTRAKSSAIRSIAGDEPTQWESTHHDPPGSESLIGVAVPRAIPGYEVVARLGRGGMGVVYRAIQQKLKRPVALKMISGDGRVDPAQLERFRIEGEAVARLRHPNVVQIYEVGEADGMPFFSLELLEGGTLAERLAGAPLAPREAAKLTATLARALEAVHRVGIVHRDMKPANVLFDTDGTPKVADFGLAKRLEVDEGHTLSGQVMGTPSYMAPEQAKGLNTGIGPATDVYALGAMLYEMLTYRPPFKGATIMETLQQVVREDPVPPSRLQSRVARDLETICLKCLEKDPSRRYPTAQDLSDDLERFLEGMPIRARPTPAWERAAKWARRRPTTAALTIIGVAAAIALGVALERHNAGVRLRARVREERIARLRMEGLDELDRSRRQQAADRVEDARVTLSTLLTKLGSEPRLADLSRRAADELRDVERKRNEAAARAADGKRFARFVRLRDQALLLDGSSTLATEVLSGGPGEAPGPGTAESPAVERRDGPTKRTRKAALEALDVFAASRDEFGPMWGRLPDSLTPGQRSELRSGGYLMFLVLSEAVARPLAGEDPATQGRLALRLLDRAAELHASTRAFHLRRAACLQRCGDREAAAAERTKAAGLKPVDAFDDLLLGRESYLEGDWDRARSHFEAALRRQPGLFWARCQLAIAELKCVPPRAAEARIHLTTCIDQDASYALLYLHRGIANGSWGVGLASQRKGEAPGVEAEERFEDAEADFRRALELGLDDQLRYTLLMDRGVMRFQRGRYEAAVEDFAGAVALDPTRFNAHASLAQALAKLGRRGEAVAALGKAIGLEPKMAALYRGRALTRLESGELPPADARAALDDFATSARLEPAKSRAASGDHVLRGRLLLRLGRPREALEAADAALAGAPDSSFARLLRVAALLELERYDEVVASCEEALAAGAPSADLYRLRGLARAGRNDFPGAIDDYTQALALRPVDGVEVHRDRGWSYVFANSPGLALRDFEAVLKLDPDGADGHAGRAAAYVRLGKLREALDDAEASVRSEKSSPRLLYIAAQTYALAAARSAGEALRRGRAASRDSLAYEARAAELLERALERTAAARRAEFWRTIVSRDPTLRALMRNPRLLQQLKPAEPSDR